jgi:hypothetical protein
VYKGLGVKKGSLQEQGIKNHLIDPRINGRIILKRIFERLHGWHKLDLSGSG